MDNVQNNVANDVAAARGRDKDAERDTTSAPAAFPGGTGRLRPRRLMVIKHAYLALRLRPHAATPAVPGQPRLVGEAC
jgi:hypothetical protein